MGASGEDLLLSPAALDVFPFSVECKNQERLGIWQALAQAEANGAENTPLLVFTRNRARTYAVVEWGRFLELVKRNDDTA